MADIVIVRVCNERDETTIDYSGKALKGNSRRWKEKGEDEMQNKM